MKNRIYSLDFLKIIATIFIFFHHYQQLVGGVFEGGINFFGGRFNFGYMVELLFMLSGFFMYPYVKQIYSGLTMKQFMIKRIKRLLPLVAICAVGFQVIALMYYHLFGRLEWFFDTKQVWYLMVAAIGMQRGWVFDDIIYVNYPVWYISVLLLCYVFFWLGTAVCKKLHTSSRYFMLIMIFWGMIINNYELNGPFMVDYTARGYISFFTGLLIASYFYDKGVSKKAVWTSVIILIVLSTLYIFKPECLEEGFVYLLCFLFYPSIIIIFSSKIVQRVFSFPVWSRIADITFNGFMWHYSVIILVLMILFGAPDVFNWYSRFGMLVFLLMVLAAGCVSHFLIENLLLKKCLKL